MLEVLASAWATAVWWAAVIFFVGLILGIVTIVASALIFLLSLAIDSWADKKEAKNRE